MLWSGKFQPCRIGTPIHPAIRRKRRARLADESRLRAATVISVRVMLPVLQEIGRIGEGELVSKQ
ncbi:MAG: hypothetical protein WAM44_04795 [Chthoniobacterales bacterium]